MYSRINKLKSSAKANGFMNFVMSYWWVILLVFAFIIYGIPFAIRQIKRQKAISLGSTLVDEAIKNDAQNHLASPVIVQQKSLTIEQKYPGASKDKHTELRTNAQRIAYALGTNVQDHHAFRWGKTVFEFFNPRAWVEDEKEAVKLAKKHSGTFPILEEYYYRVFTNSRNLKHDLLQYLSKSELDEIRQAHLHYGGYKHI